MEKNNNNAILWLAGKYLFRSIAQRSSEKVSLRYFPMLAIVSTLGVALGIMAIVVVLSIMSGFNTELSERLFGLSSHIKITGSLGSEFPDEEQLKNIFGDKVKEVESVLVGEVIIRSFVAKNPLAVGAEIRGVEKLPSAKGLEFYMPEGSEFNGIVIGEEMAGSLAVVADFGDEVELIAPMSEVAPTGELVPIRKKVPLAGTFRSGIYHYDSTVAFLPKKIAGKILGVQARPELNIKLSEPYSAEKIAGVLAKKFPDLKVSSWEETNKRLLSALRLERLAMASILFLTILISSFSIAGATSMFVSARRKDSALLLVFGMKKSSIQKVFVLQGALIGILGSFAGAVMGVIICIVLSHHRISLPDVYYLDYLPVEINVKMTIVFAFVGCILSVLSALIPVRPALSEKPIEVLRYE